MGVFWRVFLVEDLQIQFGFPGLGSGVVAVLTDNLDIGLQSGRLNHQGCPAQVFFSMRGTHENPLSEREVWKYAYDHDCRVRISCQKNQNGDIATSDREPCESVLPQNQWQ